MSAIIAGGTLLNAKALEAKLVKAFETWARFDVNDYFRDQFLSDKWAYDGETKRKSGEYVTSPRNIYDLGELYRSGRDSFSIDQGAVKTVASWNWDAKNDSGGAYAIYVHEGLSTNLTPRPWTDVLYYPQKFQNSNVSLSLKQRIKTAFAK